MKTRTVTIPKKDIFFDVDAATHVFSRATEAAGLRRADALESDTGDTMARHMLSRYADRRVGELEGDLSRFLTTPETPVTGAVVAIGTAASYEISLTVEDAFQDELLSPLATAMESYIAHGVTADWYAAAGDAQSSAFLQMMPADLLRIKEHLVKRKFPVRA